MDRVRIGISTPYCEIFVPLSVRRARYSSAHVFFRPVSRLSSADSLDTTLLTLASAHAEFITGSLFTIDDGQLL